jgi:hypothetical protein
VGFRAFPATDFPTVKLPLPRRISFQIPAFPLPHHPKYQSSRSCSLSFVPPHSSSCRSTFSLNCRFHLNSQSRSLRGPASVSHSVLDHAQLKPPPRQTRDVNIYHPEQRQLLFNHTYNCAKHISSPYHPRFRLSLHPPRPKQSPSSLQHNREASAQPKR